MEEKIKLKYPEYLDEFQCIGGKCEDSCCIGWDVDIDKKTFKSYYKVDNAEMKKMFQKNLHNNEYCMSDNIDYGRMKLKKGKRCPFLDEDNYCIIYKNIGEEYLSNVCTAFPRILNIIDGKYEMSLDVSCPEAARIFLNKEDGIKFVEKELVLGKHIVSSEINTKNKEFKYSPVKYFNEIRKMCIKIMQDRSYSLSRRLYILGIFLETIEDLTHDNLEGIPDAIKDFEVKNVALDYEQDKTNYVMQVLFFKEMLNYLNVFEEVDSEIFRDNTKKIIKGLKLNDDDISSNAKMYIEAFERYTEEYINRYSYIFENYIVNFMYNDLFPFSESESVFDGYIMILARFSFLRFYLVGKYLQDESDSKDEMIKFIQIFSKTVEHHKTYLSDLLVHIKENEFDNMEFAKSLL